VRKQIYQNGFYLVVGIILGIVSMLLVPPKTSANPTNTIQIEIVKDSVKVISKDSTVKPIIKHKKVLNEANLKEEIAKHNIPHGNIVLAQAKLESGNFKSKLTKTHNNIFGLKRGNSYKKYSHWTECVKDYKDRISSKYKGGNYYKFLNKIGYATHPEYTNILKRIS
jgi:uncharacterized FlgJ-related protein